MKKLLKNWKTVLYCLIVSFLFLMICTKSSFLYPFNDWADANCFFTMGKGMMQGKILYADLFDQKGPLIYFYYGIASLISYKSFIGVFIVEVISFTVFLYYAYKLMTIYVKKEIGYLSLPIISFIVLTLPAFTHGGSAEELTFPMLMYSMYSFTKFLKENKISYSTIFINGFVAGLVSTMKFSLLGFWFAWMAIVFFYLVYKKNYKKAFISCIVFLIGMILPIIPWLIYFIQNNALTDFINAYIIFNIKFYPSNSPFILKLMMFISKPLKFITQNLGFGLPFLLGFASLLLTKTFFKNKYYGLLVVITYFFLCIGVFTGGISFRYYYLILTPFMIYGIIELGILIQDKYHIDFKKIKMISYILMIGFFLVFSYTGSKNVPYMTINRPKEKLAQYKFAKIINKVENPTILNYGHLDGGFYTMAGVLPINKYFQKQNVPDEIFPDIINQQNEIIKNREVDFIITRELITKAVNKKYPADLVINYYPISHKTQQYEENKYVYTLWAKNEN